MLDVVVPVSASKNIFFGVFMTSDSELAIFEPADSVSLSLEMVEKVVWLPILIESQRPRDVD